MLDKKSVMKGGKQNPLVRMRGIVLAYKQRQRECIASLNDL
jgi:hypothetical protein